EGALGHLRGHTAHLEEDASRLDDDHPAFGGALAATHAGLGRLLGNRLVGEDANEDLATATHEARHHSAGRLDLPVRHPSRFGGLQAELAKRQVVALGGDAGPAASMELAIFDAGWEQHNCSLLVLLLRGAGRTRGLWYGWLLGCRGTRAGGALGCRRLAATVGGGGCLGRPGGALRLGGRCLGGR